MIASSLICQYVCVCVCVFACVRVCALKTEWKCVLCQLSFVSFQLPSSASVYVGLWSCVSLPACSRVWVIIPVCWQSRRTEGSVYADLNPLDLSCHLEYGNEEKEKKNYIHKLHFLICIQTHMNPVQTTFVYLLTLVRGSYCYGLCCELVIEVTRVRLRCDLWLEGWNKLRRSRIHFILKGTRYVKFQILHGYMS